MNINSPLFQFIDNLVDFIVLNLVFLITCIPIFTIGPALCAMYDVILREARDEGGYIVKGYIKAFKQNFKQGTIAFLIYFAIGAVLLFNIVFWKQMNTTAASILLGVILALTLLWIISFLFTFPLIARFNNSLKQTLKNSLLLPFVNISRTLGLLVLLIITACVLYILPQAKIFMVLLGFTFLIYCNSLIFIKVFKPYEEA